MLISTNSCHQSNIIMQGIKVHFKIHFIVPGLSLPVSLKYFPCFSLVYKFCLWAVIFICWQCENLSSVIWTYYLVQTNSQVCLYIRKNRVVVVLFLQLWCVYNKLFGHFWTHIILLFFCFFLVLGMKSSMTQTHSWSFSSYCNHCWAHSRVEVWLEGVQTAIIYHQGSWHLVWYGEVTAISVCGGKQGKAVVSVPFPVSRKPKPPVKL